MFPVSHPTSPQRATAPTAPLLDDDAAPTAPTRVCNIPFEALPAAVAATPRPSAGALEAPAPGNRLSVIASARDAHYLDITRTSMKGMVEKIESALPDASTRIRMFGDWIATHAPVLADPVILASPSVERGAAVLERLPGPGHHFDALAATAYTGTLFDMVLGQPAELAQNHLGLLALTLQDA